MKTEKYFADIGYEKVKENSFLIAYSKNYKGFYGSSCKRTIVINKKFGKNVDVIDPSSDDFSLSQEEIIAIFSAIKNLI